MHPRNIDWEAAYVAFINSDAPSVSAFVSRSGYFKSSVSLGTVYDHFNQIRNARAKAASNKLQGAVRCVTAQDLSASQIRTLAPSSSLAKAAKSPSLPSKEPSHGQECFIDIPGGATIRFASSCPELSAAAVLLYLQEAR